MLLGGKTNKKVAVCELAFDCCRACYGVRRFIMESGAKGCEVVVSGKLRGQRAKSMKFVDGLMIHSGEPTHDYVNTAVRHVLLRQGMYLRCFMRVCFVSGMRDPCISARSKNYYFYYKINF